MELESIMLSEVSQTVRDKYHVISPVTGISGQMICSIWGPTRPCSVSPALICAAPAPPPAMLRRPWGRGAAPQPARLQGASPKSPVTCRYTAVLVTQCSVFLPEMVSQVWPRGDAGEAPEACLPHSQVPGDRPQGGGEAGGRRWEEGKV